MVIFCISIKHHPIPAGHSQGNIQVVPNPVKSEDIQAVGEYSKFNLTWPSASEVTHGTVFYKVSIIAGSENQSVVRVLVRLIDFYIMSV